MNRIIITQTNYIIGGKVSPFELCIDLSAKYFLGYLKPSNKGVFPYKREEFETQMNLYEGEKISFEDAIYGITEALSRKFDDKKEIEVIFADTCDEETVKLYIFSFKKIFENVKTFMISDMFELITFYYSCPSGFYNKYFKQGINEVKYLFVDGFDSIIVTCDISEKIKTTYISDVYKDFGEKIEYKFEIPRPKFKSIEIKPFGVVKMYRELEFKYRVDGENMIYKFSPLYTNYKNNRGCFEYDKTDKVYFNTPTEGNVYLESEIIEKYVKKNFDEKEKYVYLGELAGRCYLSNLFESNESNETYQPFTNLGYLYEYGGNNNCDLYICDKHYNKEGKLLRLLSTTYRKDGITCITEGIKEYWEVDDSNKPEYFADKEHNYPIKKYSHSYIEGEYRYTRHYDERVSHFIPRIEGGIEDEYELKEREIGMIEFEPKYTLSTNERKEKSFFECQEIKSNFFKRMSRERREKVYQLRKEYPEICNIYNSDEIKLKIEEIFPDFKF